MFRSRELANRCPALLGGHVEVLYSAYPSLSGAAGTKLIKLLATNGAQRSSQAPDLPAISEFIPGFDFAPIIGIYARVGTSQAIIQKVAAETVAIVKEPEGGRRGRAPREPDRTNSGGPLKDETERVATAVQAAGIKPQ